MKFLKLSSILLIPIAVFTLGLVCNLIATSTNGGFMPVFMPGGCPVNPVLDHTHVCMTAASHMKFFSDWIVSNSGVSSIGDYLLEVASGLQPLVFRVWVAIGVLKLFGRDV